MQLFMELAAIWELTEHVARMAVLSIKPSIELW